MSVSITVSALLVWTSIVAITGNHLLYKATGDQLYDASSRGDLAEVRRLTGENCSDINKQSGSSKTTPLYAASRWNHTQIVMLLLSCDADPNIQSSIGMTPLIVASKYAEIDVVLALLAAHPEIDVQTKRTNMTALMMASRNGDLDVNNALIIAGPNADLQQKDGFTALMYATINAHLNVTTTLLEYGADMNIQDNNGKTALHWAAEKNLKEHVKTLLQHGADVMIKSKAGETAGDIARKLNFMDILQLINHVNATTTAAATTTDETPTATETLPTSVSVMNGHISHHVLVICMVALAIILFILMMVGCAYLYKFHIVKSSQRHEVKSQPELSTFISTNKAFVGGDGIVSIGT